MRGRNTVSNDIKLASLHHKINRKAMLLSTAQYYFNEADGYHYDNWMLEDQCIERGSRYIEAFNQTLSTPVGGYVDRYIC